MNSFQSESIKELASALSRVQSEIHSAEKDGENPFFHSSYATLTSVWKAAREPLTKNGLCVIQTTGYSEIAKTTYLITTLAHSSGEWIRGEYLINPTKNDPQGLGAAISYARRYTLSAIIGITQEDDDAESAVIRTPREEAKWTPKVTPISTVISEPQLKRLFAIAKSKNVSTEQLKSLILEQYGYESSKDITKDDYEHIIDKISG